MIAPKEMFALCCIISHKKGASAMDKTKAAEFAFDLQSSLRRLDIPDFDELRAVGMAATLAIHIKGLPEIEYEVLRKVSDHFFDIPSYALKPVLQILQEIDYVQLISSATTIKKVIPDVPHFESVYEGLGEFLGTRGLNEHEELTLEILNKLHQSPENSDRLIHSLGSDKIVFDRCIAIGSEVGYLNRIRARGRDILVAPAYFADNLDGLADMAARSGSGEIGRIIGILRNAQGWPLSIIQASKQAGRVKLDDDQVDLVRLLSGEGVLKPPTIQFGGSSETFVFTPRPGAARLNASNREIYERAMAIVSTVRKGQLLPNKFPIHSPSALLRALRSRGSLGANSEAATQYRKLVTLRIGRLVKMGLTRYQFELRQTPENIQALDMAIGLVSTGELSGAEVNQEARIALTKDETYIQSIVAAADLRRRKEVIRSEEAKRQVEQLMFSWG